ncbi:response regulator [Candidatus Giovannonibacteria bacterium]|nr:response regulator [Candidatus Giovannonibacteria bacterium]
MNPKPKIVIVDDDANKRRTYSEKFRVEGFEVFEGENGKVGLELVHKNHPDIIFTGIQMPEMTGFQMIESLKKNPEFASIPIMMNSHLGKEDDRLKAQALGINEFIYYGFMTLNDVVKRARELIK